MLKNKALTTLMATALTASMVLPGTTANAALNDLSTNHSNYNSIQSTTSKVAISSGEMSLTITSFSADTVRTSKGQLTISESLKPIFKSVNRQALNNAKATFIVENGKVIDIKALTLSNTGNTKKPVVFDGGNAKISGSITVNADYNNIQNLTISEELIVTARVKKAITIESVAVGDTITFKPLRLKKINWLNVTLKDMVTPEINVQRNKIMLDSDKLISIIQVTDDVPLLEVDSDVGKLLIDVKKDFSLRGEGKIAQATVKGGTSVYLDSSHLINKVQVDDKKAKVTYPTVDKAALTALIASIQYVTVNNNEYYNGYNNGYYNGYNTFTSEKWTTQAERTAFDTVVSSAQAVANDARATKEQVTNALTQLNSAIAIYKAAQKSYAGDKSSLTSLIKSVQYIYVTHSWDGSGLSSNTPWTTPSEKLALENAVSSAQKVVDNYYTSQYEIASAIYNLNSAITTYKNSIRNNYYGNGHFGDKTWLSTLLSSVKYVAISYSENGQDVYNNEKWTTAYAYSNFMSAETAARTVMNDQYASQEQINTAASNLQNAIYTYERSQSYGSRPY